MFEMVYNICSVCERTSQVKVQGLERSCQQVIIYSPMRREPYNSMKLNIHSDPVRPETQMRCRGRLQIGNKMAEGQNC